MFVHTVNFLSGKVSTFSFCSQKSNFHSRNWKFEVAFLRIEGVGYGDLLCFTEKYSIEDYCECKGIPLSIVEKYTEECFDLPMRDEYEIQLKRFVKKIIPPSSYKKLKWFDVKLNYIRIQVAKYNKILSLIISIEKQYSKFKLFDKNVVSIIKEFTGIRWYLNG